MNAFNAELFEEVGGRRWRLVPPRNGQIVATSGESCVHREHGEDDMLRSIFEGAENLKLRESS